jgi:hypothetical protein
MDRNGRANGVGYDRNEEELWVRQKSLQDDPPLNINNYSACRQCETDLDTILGVDTIIVTVGRSTPTTQSAACRSVLVDQYA